MFGNAANNRLTMKIKEMCEAERPRERLLAAGAGAMSNSELLAILLRTGYGGYSALDLAQSILKRFEGSLTAIAGLSVEELSRIPGIKSGKASTLCAALELGRRFISEKSSGRKTAVSGADVVYRIMKPVLKGLRHEECWVILMNRSNQVLKKAKLTSGGSSATVIDVGQIIRLALDSHAASVVLVHNHPSGNPFPSKADIEQTRLLKDAVNSVQIDLLDHVIVCDDSYFSFSAEQ